MTREEAKGNLIHAIRWDCAPMKEAVEMAIQVLEQEPCENAISRQAALKCFTWTNDKADIWNRIKALPSVNPQPKTGRWIDKDVRGSIEPYCSVCGDSLDTIYHYNYCPNCGAKMVEPQERSDEE